MRTFSHSQVLELVKRLPAKRLPVAYRFLRDLSAADADSPSAHDEFLLLPIAKRRRLMAEQARQMLVHYKQTASERRTWQVGDFVEY